MTQFNGFPRRMEFTAVPNLFFSQVLPRISDMAELQTTLHIIKILYRKKGTPRFTSIHELLDDKALVSCLKENECNIQAALKAALALAEKRGTIIHLTMDKQGVAEDIYFLNTEENRSLVPQIQCGEMVLGELKYQPPAEIDITEPDNIFALYEDNIGLLTPLVADELRDAENLYPAVWIKDAIKEAVANNARNWRYIVTILEHWSTQGKTDGTYRRDSKTDPDKYVKGKYGHMVRQ